MCSCVFFQQFLTLAIRKWFGEFSSSATCRLALVKRKWSISYPIMHLWAKKQRLSFSRFHSNLLDLCYYLKVLKCRVMSSSRSYGHHQSASAQVLLESSFEVSRCVHALHGMYYEGQPIAVRKVSILFSSILSIYLFWLNLANLQKSY